jgi:hypothetical protein
LFTPSIHRRHSQTKEQEKLGFCEVTKKKEKKVERQTDFVSSRHPQKSLSFPTKNCSDKKELQLPSTEAKT